MIWTKWSTLTWVPSTHMLHWKYMYTYFHICCCPLPLRSLTNALSYTHTSAWSKSFYCCTSTHGSLIACIFCLPLSYSLFTIAVFCKGSSYFWIFRKVLAAFPRKWQSSFLMKWQCHERVKCLCHLILWKYLTLNGNWERRQTMPQFIPEDERLWKLRTTATLWVQCRRYSPVTELFSWSLGEKIPPGLLLDWVFTPKVLGSPCRKALRTYLALLYKPFWLAPCYRLYQEPPVSCVSTPVSNQGKKKKCSSVLVIITCAEEGKNDSSGLRVAERWHIALDHKGCFVFKSWPGALSCERIFCLAFRNLRKCLPNLRPLWVQFSHSVPVASHTVAIQSPQSYIKTNADDCFDLSESIVLWADDMVKEPHIEWFSVIWPFEYLPTNYSDNQGRSFIYSIYRAVSGQVNIWWL